MKYKIISLLIILLPIYLSAQDLSEGLIVNDLTAHPMQQIDKPAYLNTIIDPSFGTTIRRISDAGTGGVIVPMYSTIQAWNADESLMILYNQSGSYHELLDGMTYEVIRKLDDVRPADLEQIFWDFEDPNIFYYPERQTNDFIKYHVNTRGKETLVNLETVLNCSGDIRMGNDIQMMSWDSDVFAFRCNNESSYTYRLSTGELTTFNVGNSGNTAMSVAPSGNRFYHKSRVYDKSGNSIMNLNESSTEHSCIGKLANGNDAHFAIAFAQGPQGGCIGDIIAHDLISGTCFPVISQSQGYDYPQSGTHISALAHKNTEGGWMAASMVGYDRDGQSLLDQELVIAKAEKGNIKVCRIGHHRSDEEEYDYWGEPHAVISPTGTRVLFASDWSGSEDGQSVDSYVVELPSFGTTVSTETVLQQQQGYKVIPNPFNDAAILEFDNPTNQQVFLKVYSADGKLIHSDKTNLNNYQIEANQFNAGLYFFLISDLEGNYTRGKFIKT